MGKKGGGMALHFKNGICFRVTDNSEENYLKTLTDNIPTDKAQDGAAAGVRYRPPMTLENRMTSSSRIYL